MFEILTKRKLTTSLVLNNRAQMFWKGKLHLMHSLTKNLLINMANSVDPNQTRHLPHLVCLQSLPMSSYGSPGINKLS